MKLLRKIIGTIILLAATALSVAVLFAAVSSARWTELSSMVARGRFTAVFGAIAVLCLVFIMTATLRRRDRKSRILSFHNDDGTVSISTTAIEDYICKLGSEFPSVVRMVPSVLPRRGCVDILVHVRIKAGPQIHEICEVLQRRVRETLTTGLGISEVRRVEVSVTEISPEHKSS